MLGRTIENEDLVNLPNWLPLTFRIEGSDWFDLQNVEVLEYRQELDVQKGVLTRDVRFGDSQGRTTRLIQRRFVHMADAHLAGLEMTIVPENWSGRIDVLSALDGRVTNAGVERYRQLNGRHLVPVESAPVGEDTIYLRVETSQSRIHIAEAARTRLLRKDQIITMDRRLIQEPGYVGQEFSIDLVEGEDVRIEKIAALFTSRDPAISECGLESRIRVARAPDFDSLLGSHVLAWHDLWRRFRIEIQGDERSAQILNVHIFHLLQTASPNSIDLDTSIPPRGLHGEAYRGHIFWDELFIFPVISLRIPELTRSLLGYRYRRLPEARWAAGQAGYSGANYPWQSGSNGREESQTLHLNPRSKRWIPDNSHLQRHINSAVAYNIWHYYQVTSDMDLMCSYGAEVMIEVSRFWASIAQYNRTIDRYEIRKVMGPDEYHDSYPNAQEPGVDNNAYTNVMAVWLLCRTLELVKVLPEDRQKALQERLALTQEELERWEDISRKMHVPFHSDGVISQFEGYGELMELDWEGYKEKYGGIQRLDRILEAEGDTPNRYKVSKQPDVLMLFYLLSQDELRDLFRRLGYAFEDQTMLNNIEYYLQRTCHGSTLSRVVYSWVLSKYQREGSWMFFKEALESDVSDIQGGTTAEGIHLGAMAGTVDIIQRCYTGIETRNDILWLNPVLPKELTELQFDLRYRHHVISLGITQERLKLRVCACDRPPIKVGFKDQIYEIIAGHTKEFALESTEGSPR